MPSTPTPAPAATVDDNEGDEQPDQPGEHLRWVPTGGQHERGGQMSERNRVKVFQWLSDELGEEPAEQMMAMMQPVPLGSLATKSDLERFPTKSDLERFATKSDLERFATKSDLERFPTKSDLERFATKSDLERFPTKDDLRSELANYATKDDLQHFATKADLETGFSKMSWRLASLLVLATSVQMGLTTALFTLAN